MDELDTVWPASAHTLAKHKILKGYLDAWMPILSRQSKAVGAKENVLYVDAFAGPGVYTGGEDGSPIIALKAALAQSPFPTPIQFVFLEQDPPRVEVLRKTIDGYRDQLNRRPDLLVPAPLEGDSDKILREQLDLLEKQGRRFGPALLFLDQFGYSSVAMDLVRRVLRFPQCEVFSYLDATGPNRFINDPNKWSAMDRAFGGRVWEDAKSLKGVQQANFLRAKYAEQLKAAGARYVLDFAMYGPGNKPLYWLFYCTGHLKGLEVMKKAMWKVDDSGTFRFSDADDPGQFKLLSGFDDEWLATDLSRTLDGQTMTVDEIEEHVLTRTPCHKFKSVLATLEKRGALQVPEPPDGRRAGAFADGDMKISFGGKQRTLF